MAKSLATVEVVPRPPEKVSISYAVDRAGEEWALYRIKTQGDKVLERKEVARDFMRRVCIRKAEMALGDEK